MFADTVTISGTQTFASLDGSSADRDGASNGVFTVTGGDLVVNGVVNCNNAGASDNACSMAFAASGNITINAGGALYAENRSGSGSAGNITVTAGGNVALNGNAIISTSAKSSRGSTGGAIAVTAGGSIAIASGSTIDSGSVNARGGNIVLDADGTVSVNGNILSGPSRTLAATRLGGGAALDGGTSNTIGGSISINSSTFAEPAIVVGATANIVSQGASASVTIDGCGVQVKGLVAAIGNKDGAATANIRSGKDVLIDGRDLGTANGARMGRVRADQSTGNAAGNSVNVFASETVDVFGPAGALHALTSVPGANDAKSRGGVIRIISLGDAVNAAGNVADTGHTASGAAGGTIEIAAKEDANLNTAVLRAIGDLKTGNNGRRGGAIRVRSYSGDVIWTNGIGEVRPVGSTSGLPLAEQGSIVLTACGSVTTTGSTFPAMGVA
ncbi:MAG TPA: hypothetical protein VE010_00720, partial [Thermoanaerobaculia bacterium]|nr:hypothetical protein [Thermoanaerobaculia bacterium]